MSNSIASMLDLMGETLWEDRPNAVPLKEGAPDLSRVGLFVVVYAIAVIVLAIGVGVAMEYAFDSCVI